MISRAATMAPAGTCNGAVSPSSTRSTRFSRSRRSLARSASSRLPSAWRISHWAWIARCQAWAAPTPWSISMSAASSRPGSSSSARCAEKIAASFSSPLSLACCRLPCTSSRTRCRAWSRARCCSSGRCRPSSAGRLMAPSRARGPLARPGEAQTPVRVPATAAGRAASPGAMARGASFGAPAVALARAASRAPRAASLSSPRQITSTSSCSATPRPMMPTRLSTLATCPAKCSSAWLEKPCAVLRSSAAGRACRPP